MLTAPRFPGVLFSHPRGRVVIAPGSLSRRAPVPRGGRSYNVTLSRLLRRLTAHPWGTLPVGHGLQRITLSRCVTLSRRVQGVARGSRCAAWLTAHPFIRGTHSFPDTLSRGAGLHSGALMRGRAYPRARVRGGRCSGSRSFPALSRARFDGSPVALITCSGLHGGAGALSRRSRGLLLQRCGVCGAHALPVPGAHSCGRVLFPVWVLSRLPVRAHSRAGRGGRSWLQGSPLPLILSLVALPARVLTHARAWCCAFRALSAWAWFPVCSVAGVTGLFPGAAPLSHSLVGSRARGYVARTYPVRVIIFMQIRGLNCTNILGVSCVPFAP